jgi:actin-related protein
MAQTPSYDLRKTSLTRTRPAPSTLQTSGSPHTPLSRSVSGLYGSPGSSFRVDEENNLILDIGSRVLRAGFAGEPAPRCYISYRPELWRRVGDYREFDVEYEAAKKGKEKWGDGNELWCPDLRDLDLGFVEDKVERLIRECAGKYLMLDSRTKRVSLVVSSSLPRPLLNLTLKRIFEGLQAPTVTLLPSSIMATVAAGLRSALVLDIGWHESIVTAVCEYREVMQKRSIRAGKMMSEEFRQMLTEELGEVDNNESEISFEEAEEVMTRMGWCRDSIPSSDEDGQPPQASIPLRKRTLKIPFSRLSQPADIALFDTAPSLESDDEHNVPLPKLVYKTLLALPIDIRQICMSRILITGGPSAMPGLKRRILHDVQDIVKERGWDPVINYGSAKKLPLRRTALTERNANLQPDLLLKVEKVRTKRSSSSTDEGDQDLTSLPASAQPQESDPIITKLLSNSTLSSNLRSPHPSDSHSETQPPPLRIIQTLGPWPGASLLSNLRIRGAVEVEKDRFTQYGFVGGASAPGAGKGTVVPERGRQSLMPGGKGERASWGMGVWG